MSSSNSNLNTLYGPYRTSEAVRRAPNADFIPLEGDRNLNAVHPIPVEWLQEELLPRERQRVREHVANQINAFRFCDYGYAEALEATMANLNTVSTTATATRSIPAPRPATNDLDRLANEFGDLTTAPSQGVQAPSRGVRFTETVQEERVFSPTRGVRFSEEVQTGRVSRDFRISGPHSPQSSSPPPRIIHRSPSHSRNTSASSTMSFFRLPERNVRAPSPTAALQDELVALDVQLDEIHGRVNEATSPQGAVRDRRNTNVATARSNICRLRSLRILTREDVDEARAGVHSVMSAAGRDEGELPIANGGLRGGRGLRQSRPTSNIPSGMSEQVRLATYQQQRRDHAYSINTFPVWRSPPVDPQRGDGFEGLDGEIRRFNRHGCWQLNDGDRYGRMPYYCD
jgi:hypothetical protein